MKTNGQAEAIRPPIKNLVHSTLHWKTDFKKILIIKGD